MGDNTFSKTYADGAALTATQLDTAYKSVSPDLAQMALMTTGSTAGQFLKSQGSNTAPAFAAVPDPKGPFALRNYGLAATASTAGLLTISIKTNAGSDPTTIDAVDFTYSTNGTTTATYNAVSVTAAASISVNASATLGNATTATQRVYVYGYYNTATSSVKLAVSSNGSRDNGDKITTVAVSATADSGTVMYATAVLSVATRLLGWVDVAHATAAGGNWQTPIRVSISNNSNSAAYRAIKAASCSTYNNTSTSVTTVTNQSLSVTTNGNPVLILFESIPTSTENLAASFVLISVSGSVAGADLLLRRDGTTISKWRFTGIGTSGFAEYWPISLSFTDDNAGSGLAAGTYTYTLSARLTTTLGNNTFSVNYGNLVIREL